jgi:hypothetical protein
MSVFYLFPNMLNLIFSITLGYSSELVDDKFFVYNLLISLSLILSIIIFTKISYKAIHCLNMFFCLAFIILTIFLILKQII